jgi:hypothetical protein
MTAPTFAPGLLFAQLANSYFSGRWGRRVVSGECRRLVGGGGGTGAGDEALSGRPSAGGSRAAIRSGGAHRWGLFRAGD